MMKPSTLGGAAADLTTAVIGTLQFKDSVPLAALAAVTLGLSLWSLTSVLFTWTHQPVPERIDFDHRLTKKHR